MRYRVVRTVVPWRSPRALESDNLKSAVTMSSRFEPKVNKIIADYAEHYDTAILPTRAYGPRDKATV
ncbi:hypothetical protein [Flagellimonas marina]|uniref:Integrase catalytic domain-containing protein n=1 Tax=Flagellimonas marina TaxID=1775168 RepID=A0ABV8PSE7_9FLAO